MTKVCQITSVHSRYDGRIFSKIAVSLANHGYQSCVLCCDNQPEEVKDGVTVYSVNFVPKNRIERILLSGRKLFEKAIEIDAEIYHLHDPELLRLGVRLKKAGKKVIFDSHEDYVAAIREKEWLPKIVRSFIANIYQKKEASALVKIDGVVSVTPHIIERLKKINNNTVMITNYPRLTDPIVHNAQQFSLCFAGGISPQWKHENIIKALEAFGGKVRYILIGDTSSPYFENLKKIKGFKYVDALGIMPYSEVLKNYSKASVGIALNDYVANVDFRNGSLGNTKLFEFMMAGLPVIGTDFELWKTIIEGNNAGICVNPISVDMIAEAIGFLLNNPEKRKEFGINSRKASERQYNWKTQEAKLLDFYKTLER